MEAHLSPATFADNSVVKYPDATPGETLSYAKTFSIDVSPGSDGDLFVYVLPFVEVPLATYSKSGGWSFYCDPNMGGASWMSDNGVYAFRCLGQSATVYNTTAEIYKQGNVNAAVLRSCLDSHEVYNVVAAGGSNAEIRIEKYRATMIDGIPMSVAEITSNSKHPYIGRAADGVYIVNRNFGGFDWIFRNGIENKGQTTQFYTITGVQTTSSAPTAITSMTRNYNYPARSALLVPTAYNQKGAFTAPQATLVTGTNAYGRTNVTVTQGLVSALDEAAGVSGFQGNNYGVAVAGFTGLSTQTSLTIKFKHMYEFMLKPSSPYTPMTSPGWADARWVNDVIRKQLLDKPDAFHADANFFGAILKGVKALWPAVAPVLGKGLSALGNFLISKGGTTSRETADNPDMVSPPKRSAARATARKRAKAGKRKQKAVISAEADLPVEKYTTKNGFAVVRRGRK